MKTVFEIYVIESVIFSDEYMPDFRYFRKEDSLVNDKGKLTVKKYYGDENIDLCWVVSVILYALTFSFWVHCYRTINELSVIRERIVGNTLIEILEPTRLEKLMKAICRIIWSKGLYFTNTYRSFKGSGTSWVLARLTTERAHVKSWHGNFTYSNILKNLSNWW